MGQEQMTALKEEVDKLLKAKFIIPVETTEWVSATMVTPKKDGRWRICVDFKPLNKATKKDPYPLPFIDQILDSVAGHERYSICDGYSGYFQLKIATKDQKKDLVHYTMGLFLLHSATIWVIKWSCSLPKEGKLGTLSIYWQLCEGLH